MTSFHVPLVGFAKPTWPHPLTLIECKNHIHQRIGPIGSSPLEKKYRDSISWSRLNITDLIVYKLPYYLKF